MGKGYGSEWNLARYLGHRCGELDAAVAGGPEGGLSGGWMPVDRRTGRPIKEWEYS